VSGLPFDSGAELWLVDVTRSECNCSHWVLHFLLVIHDAPSGA
jgi:hypothetical protein